MISTLKYRPYKKVIESSLRTPKASFHTSLPSLNVSVKSIPKKHPIRRFIIQLTLLAGTFYGVGTYASLKNNTFNDYFTEYVPLAEELVSAVEDNKGYFLDSDLSDLKKKIEELKNKTVKIPQEGAVSEKIGDIYNTVKAKGVQVLGMDEKSTATKTKDETVSKSETVVVKQVPKVEIPIIVHTSDSSEVNVMISKLNALITSINSVSERGFSKDFQNLISQVQSSVSTISSKLQALEADKEDIMKDLNGKINSEMEIKLAEAKNSLTKQFLDNFNDEIKSIKSKYEKQLANDVTINKQTLQLEYENKLKAAQIAQLKSVEKSIGEYIENERSGKLKNLNELGKKIEALQKFEIELAAGFEKFSKYNEISVVLDNLKKLIFSSHTYRDNLVELESNKIVDELNKLKELTSDDDLLAKAVSSIPIEEIRTTGLLSNAQLRSRWNLLAPELQSASLLPPNAGILGHLSAKFFSFFLISKEGNVQNGNDVSSIIVRVNYKLENNDLDDAIEIVSSLKGWSRKLSADWLVEARKKLELEFLVDLIDTELKYEN